MNIHTFANLLLGFSFMVFIIMVAHQPMKHDNLPNVSLNKLLKHTRNIGFVYGVVVSCIAISFVMMFTHPEKIRLILATVN